MGSTEISWKLANHPNLPKGKTVAVVVLDGWGEAKPDKYNCIHTAKTPTMDSLKEVPIAIRGPGLAAGVRFRSDVPNGGLPNVAATFINLHGFGAPTDYETTLIEVVDN